MSKLGDIVAIPIALFALKTLTAQVKDEEEVKPIVKADPFIKPLDIGPIGFVGPLIGGGGTQNGGPKPTGPPTGLGFGIDAPDFEPVGGLIQEFGKVGEGIKGLKELNFNWPDEYKPFDVSLFPDLSRLAELQKKQSMEK